MITQYKELLDSIINPETKYLVQDPNGNRVIKAEPEVGDHIIEKLSKDNQLNQLVIELFGDTSELGRKLERKPDDKGVYWLTKAEYEYLLALFTELRRRTPSPYLSDVEKDHPLFKRVRVRGILSSSTTGGV